jgi:hypothetical protein
VRLVLALASVAALATAAAFLIDGGNPPSETPPPDARSAATGAVAASPPPERDAVRPRPAVGPPAARAAAPRAEGPLSSSSSSGDPSLATAPEPPAALDAEEDKLITGNVDLATRALDLARLRALGIPGDQQRQSDYAAASAKQTERLAKAGYIDAPSDDASSPAR